MTSHQHISIECKVIPFLVIPKDLQIALVVLCAPEDPLLLVAARDHMVQGSFILDDSRFPCHAMFRPYQITLTMSINKSDPQYPPRRRFACGRNNYDGRITI
jgi:hypothetical protein